MGLAVEALPGPGHPSRGGPRSPATPGRGAGPARRRGTPRRAARCGPRPFGRSGRPRLTTVRSRRGAPVPPRWRTRRRSAGRGRPVAGQRPQQVRTVGLLLLDPSQRGRHGLPGVRVEADPVPHPPGGAFSRRDGAAHEPEPGPGLCPGHQVRDRVGLRHRRVQQAQRLLEYARHVPRFGPAPGSGHARHPRSGPGQHPPRMPEQRAVRGHRGRHRLLVESPQMGSGGWRRPSTTGGRSVGDAEGRTT